VTTTSATTSATTSTAASVDDTLGHRAGTTDFRRVVASLFAAGVATFALLYSTQALLPELAEQFHVSSATSTLSLSVTTVGLGFALLVAGPLSERFGRTRLIHLSLGAATVVAATCAVAPTWHVLLVLRLVQGVVLAGLPAVATAYLREELHPSTHARAAGLYVGGTALGGMTGRLATGAVGEVAGWRWALAAAALLGLLCALVVRLTLPESRRFRPAGLSPRSVVTMARRALGDPALLALYAIGACAVGAFIAVFNGLGFRLAAAPFHLGLGAASLVFLVYPLGSIGSAVGGRLADRVGRRAIAPLGCLLAVFGVVLTLPSSLPWVVAGVALLTAGFFVVHGVASGWVPARAHAGGVATAQAASLYLFAYYAGSSLFGSLAGQAWSWSGWSGVAVLSTTLLVVSGTLTLRLRRTPALVG
jgi:YNFM family putative membrane transporter